MKVAHVTHDREVRVLGRGWVPRCDQQRRLQLLDALRLLCLARQGGLAFRDLCEDVGGCRVLRQLEDLGEWDLESILIRCLFGPVVARAVDL
jgi:hypothetical protein